MLTDYQFLPKKWQERVQIIDALEYKSFQGFCKSLKGLQNLQKLKTAWGMMSVLGGIFGPFYYLALGMWRKSLSLCGIYLLTIFSITAIFQVIHGEPTDEAMILYEKCFKFGCYAVALISSWSVSFDYYAKVKSNDKSWMLAFFKKPIEINNGADEGINSFSSQQRLKEDVSDNSDLDRLLKLSELKEKGIISSEEFESQKKKIL
jgi:hypothetical protein